MLMLLMLLMLPPFRPQQLLVLPPFRPQQLLMLPPLAATKAAGSNRPLLLRQPRLASPLAATPDDLGPNHPLEALGHNRPLLATEALVFPGHLAKAASANLAKGYNQPNLVPHLVAPFAIQPHLAAAFAKSATSSATFGDSSCTVANQPNLVAPNQRNLESPEAQESGKALGSGLAVWA